MNLEEYLISLAQDGETTLFVQQKPVKGQTYNNGDQKFVWPASIATTRPRKGAWYGNTAIFVKDRFKDRPSATGANADYVGVMVLDDIGTKSLIPPLPPTWIMETSPENYQWGYGFSEQPTVANFEAAIIAIAEAGYTDKGAINAVRNFRLPDSINLKLGRNSFASRLVEFHPDREYTLDEICTAFAVTPAEANTARHISLGLDDDGADDIAAWLSGKSLVLEKANSSGWMGVVCPNAAEHTDGNPMGRYHPSHRSYCCLHAHCGDWDSNRFLTWVEEEGGPQHQTGLRAELLATIMAPALEKLAPQRVNSQFEDSDEKVIEEVTRKEMGRLEKTQLHGRFAYVETDDSYFDMITRRELSRGAFNAIYRHLDCKRGKTRIEASVWFDQHRQAVGGKILAGIAYASGESELVIKDGLVYGNKWIDARPPVKAGDITPWMAHCRHLIPDEKELNHLLDMFVFKLQFPTAKINHAALVAGRVGVGKDTMMAPLLRAICGPHSFNYGLIDLRKFEWQWGYAYESEVVVINELRPDQYKDQRAIENTLKPIIAAPPDTITINRKGLHPYQANNKLLVLAYSNFRDAIALPSEDRRWFCVWCEGGPMKGAAELWKWYEAGGFEAVAAWLMARDVSKFNPGARPPLTEAKAVMIESSRSGGEEYLIELMNARLSEFATGVIAAPFHKVIDRLQALAPAGQRLTHHALQHCLQEAGWIDLGRIHSADFPSNRRVFAAPEIVEKHSKSEIRRLCEAPQAAGGLVVVK